MASEEPETPVAAGGEDEPEETPGYKAPEKKSLKEITELDQDDESLVKYKQALLGAGGGAKDVLDEGGSNVLVKSIALVVEGREDVVLDLTGDLSQLKSKPFTIKEGANYKLRISFRVQREIVAGLVLHNVTYRKGVRVDRSKYMMGSYGPKSEVQEFLTPLEDAPRGMLARGTYSVKSKFVDDDKHVYKEWEWVFSIAKEW